MTNIVCFDSFSLLPGCSYYADDDGYHRGRLCFGVRLGVRGHVSVPVQSRSAPIILSLSHFGFFFLLSKSFQNLDRLEVFIHSFESIRHQFILRCSNVPFDTACQVLQNQKRHEWYTS